MLDIDDAILATTKITPAKISTGESQAGSYTQKLTLENSSSAAVTYDLSYVNALSTGGVITPAFYSSDASVTFNRASVMVAGGWKSKRDGNDPSGYWPRSSTIRWLHRLHPAGWRAGVPRAVCWFRR